MESAGDEASDAAEVERRLVSIRKGQAKLRVVADRGLQVCLHLRRGRLHGSASPRPRGAAGCMHVCVPPPSLSPCHPVLPNLSISLRPLHRSLATLRSWTSVRRGPTLGRSWWGPPASRCGWTPTMQTRRSCQVRGWVAWRGLKWWQGWVPGAGNRVRDNPGLSAGAGSLAFAFVHPACLPTSLQALWPSSAG